MYQVYKKDESSFDPKNLIAEYGDINKAYERVEKELEKDKDFKYVIEETTGFVDNYGELIATVVDEN